MGKSSPQDLQWRNTRRQVLLRSNPHLHTGQWGPLFSKPFSPPDFTPSGLSAGDSARTGGEAEEVMPFINYRKISVHNPIRRGLLQAHKPSHQASRFSEDHGLRLSAVLRNIPGKWRVYNFSFFSLRSPSPFRRSDRTPVGRFNRNPFRICAKGG